MLLQQGRYELAEQELRRALGADPQDHMAHAFMGICLPEREKFDEAVEMARNAVGLAPDNSFCHYALAVALFHRDHHATNKKMLFTNLKEFKESEASIQEAIRIDPYEAMYFAMLSFMPHLMGRY